MPAVTEAAVRKALDDFRDPETGRSVTQLEQVHNVRLADGNLLEFTLKNTGWEKAFATQAAQSKQSPRER